MDKKRVPVESFVMSYLAAVRDGKTYQQLADELGMKHSTVYQRAYELRKRGFTDLKPLASAARRESFEKRAEKAVKEFLEGGVSPKEKPKPAPKKQTEKQAEVKAALKDGDELENDEAETLDSIFG
jgi:DNA-binding transcriptional ArsR family regulator